MKKWLLILVVIIGLLVTSAYIFFPKVVNISNNEKINCNINSATRTMMIENKWARWWPGTVEHDSLSNTNVFVYNGYKYVITGHKYNAVIIQTRAKEFTIDGTIFFLPVKIDSIQAEWK